MNQKNDDILWQIAKKRARFKKDLFSYLIVNAFLWAIWWVSNGKIIGNHAYPWPIWVMLGWGVGLAFQYFSAYHGNTRSLTLEEYEKLKNEQKD